MQQQVATLLAADCAQANIGRTGNPHHIGGQVDVIAVTGAQRQNAGCHQVALVVNRDATIKCRDCAQRQVAKITQVDVAGGRQVHIRRCDIRIEVNSVVARHIQGLRGNQAAWRALSQPVAVDQILVGLGNRAVVRRQANADTGLEGGVGHLDAAAVDTGTQYEIAGSGLDFGLSIGADGAIAGSTGTGMQNHRGSQDRAAHTQVPA